MKQYQIVTTGDSAVRGRYDLKGLEVALNEAARQGWRVISSHQAGNALKSFQTQIVVILERDVT